jgi:high affinity sulfate transporter 1
MSANGPDPASVKQPLFAWRALFPPAQWLSNYQIPWLRHDAIAGLTLAAYVIPESMAYATLAGLPPQYGVYCYLVAGPVYALLGSSRQLAIGPTSAISLLIGSTLSGMAAGDPQRWLQIAALTALTFGAISLLAWALRLSTLVSFISETILLGFKAGAALTIAMTQLPKLFGIHGGSGNFFERAWSFGTQLPQTNLAVLAFGLAAIVALLAGERFLRGRPVSLVVVAASIILMSLTPLAHLGVKTVAALPAGLPHFSFPLLRLREVDGILPLALACFLLAYIEGISAARTLASKRGYEVDPRQELLALGVTNCAVALAQGYPVAGGLSQSTVNDEAGARTPLALVVASLAIALCLLYLTGLLANMPEVILAAIVLVAVKGLVKIDELRQVWELSRTEFWVAMTTMGGVLLLGILKGVLLATLVSMLLLIRDAARPHVARLGRVPGTRVYSDCERHPENELITGVLIVRVESSLLYFNVGHVADEVRALIATQQGSLRLLVWDLSTSPYVDVAAGRLLGDIQRELAARRITMRIVDAHSRVRDLLRKELGTSVGEISRRLSIEDVVSSAI